MPFPVSAVALLTISTPRLSADVHPRKNNVMRLRQRTGSAEEPTGRLTLCIPIGVLAKRMIVQHHVCMKSKLLHVLKEARVPFGFISDSACIIFPDGLWSGGKIELRLFP